jgi:iron only hydrogenase large subunit-like protein
MEQRYPIYSEETRCRDCYKCVRECPVKAIRVVDNEAAVIPENCILCGHCVTVCPVGAKRVRDDLRRVLHLLKRNNRVILSLAPSFAGEFRDIPYQKLIAGIKKLGFYGVSETALGAEEVSAAVSKSISRKPIGMQLSSACPAAVELTVKYFPHLADKISPIFSPLLAHCTMLKRIYGEATGIVFAGPCIAKKKEADEHPHLLDVVISFEDLRKWFDLAGIDINTLEVTPDNSFIPVMAKNGALYPIEGGMIATIKNNPYSNTRFMTLSGVQNISKAFESLSDDQIEGNLFIELLACENGCIRGPKASNSTPIGSRLAVLDFADNTFPETENKDDIISCEYTALKFAGCTPTSKQISDALESIGKSTPVEELNCGSCGYGTCRELARALVEKKAETCMCSSFMRQLAQKKANALIKTIPYGVVIVDQNMRIIDSNEKFAHLLGPEIIDISKVIPGLTHADFTSIVPFHHLFTHVLTTSEEINQHFVKYLDRVIAITIFIVEKTKIVGAILRDATITEYRREQIVEKAQEVIRNNSLTAQQIAFLMGKNAAQSEKILNSLIESFSFDENDSTHQE